VFSLNMQRNPSLAISASVPFIAVLSGSPRSAIWTSILGQIFVVSRQILQSFPD
jgi:hypothetical protein